MLEQIEFTTRNILERTGDFSPSVGIILGSGLGGLVKEINIAFSIPYNEISGFAENSGNLIFGELGGKKIVAMQNRYHFYDGYSMQDIAFPIRVMRALGVQTLCVSNASGGMNPDYEIGEVVVITDHISLLPINPLLGKNIDALGPRFPDMGEVYKKTYVALAKQIAQENNIKVSEGVYVGVTGPCFETPSEYRYMRRIGGDIVGMSTVPEVITARHAGMDIFGISIVTDLGVEGYVQKVTHEEVLHIASLQEPKLTLIVKELVKRI